MLFLPLAACGSDTGSPAPKPVLPAADSAPASQPSDTRPVILAFGDSLTAGHGLPPGAGYPELLQEALDKQGYPYRVVNAGISGDTSGGGVGRLQAALDLKPAVVILELGANDGLQGIPTASTRANLKEMIMAFETNGAKVILAGMTLPRNFGPDYISSFEKIFTDLAREHDIALIPFFLEGVVGNPELVLEDGVHPNSAGYRVVTETVLRYLRPVLLSR